MTACFSEKWQQATPCTKFSVQETRGREERRMKILVATEIKRNAKKTHKKNPNKKKKKEI